MSVAAYDSYADWYEDYVTAGTGGDYHRRLGHLLAELLGAGTGTCLEVCCGTGIHAATLRDLGWTPVGIDLSGGQLRHAAARLPVARADAAELPVRAGSVPAVLVALSHTDVDDYPAVLREVARVLAPGGRLVHLGIHPCFTGAFADRSDPRRLVLSGGYHDTHRRYDAWSPHGVRARVGATHLPLAALLTAVLDAGLTLTAARETGPDGAYPDLLALTAHKPT
jgi:ubiquinone/menaquinone biosynthesis C-methylase UbiE